jgi:demethylmenaquinone methyltransferase/2-methoxy-6-polyprenyl-1,4-benzoquinol methylase
VRLCGSRNGAQLVLERHRSNNTPVSATGSERNRMALGLFAPLGPTYDRYASLLSFGQDPRWRRFLVSRVDVGPEASVLDVATGTGAVAIELARRYGCSVTGIDQSEEMLAEAARRVTRARLAGRIRFEAGRAEALPFPDGSFDALTVTYLLRYVDDPGATLAELARVVRPGGIVASLEFFVPAGTLTGPLWNLYVDVLLPAAGRLISPGWHEVGRFLGPSIRDHYRRLPLERQLELWRAAGIRDVRHRSLSLGGGIVVWGVRGD